MLVEIKKTSKKANDAFESIKKIEIYTANIHLNIKLLEQNYAQDTLNLVLATGYLKKLLGNNKIEQYLARNYTEIYSEFESIIKSNTSTFS